MFTLLLVHSIVNVERGNILFDLFLQTHMTPEVTLTNVQGIEEQAQLAMIDGKVCNILICTKSIQKGYVCSATPKEMNSL